MPAPVAAPTAARRLVLVPTTSRRPAKPDAQLRRYRLARVQLDGRERLERERRFEHLKRCYD